MQKTAIRIDRELAAEAQCALGTPTLTATVNSALEEVVARDKREGFIAYWTQRKITPGELDEIDRPSPG